MQLFAGRRTVLKLVAGGCVMIAEGARGGGTMDPVVETRLGKVRGIAGESHLSFRGIRYAVAERFRQPTRPLPHAGIADATMFGAIAPQADPAAKGPPAVILAHLPRAPNAPLPPKANEAEDCLFLNVWTPTVNRSANLPVMVYLHGGFFYSGSGSMGDGSKLAARGDVVVVSLNHRLNALGFSNIEDIAGKDFAQSGNLGMLDIVAALEWVRDNIEVFGGDPKRVMVFGASGGGMKTSWLLASPRANGLYARAGIQSGPALRMLARERAATAADMLLRELGLTAASANDARILPVEALVAAYHRVVAKHPATAFTDLPGFAPVLDPVLLPQHPFSPTAPTQSANIPLLIGSNADEMSFFAGNDQAVFDLSRADLERRVTDLLGSDASKALTSYCAAYPNLSPTRLFLRLYSDQQILVPTTIQADRKEIGSEAPVFAYHLTWPSPALSGKLGATHTLENALVFGQLSSPLVGNAEGAAAISRRMSEAWVSFARDGKPGNGWNAYGKTRETLIIDAQSHMATNPFTREMDLFADFYR